MRILYGVVGEGMGHATRSRVVIDRLLSWGHEVKVVVSGRAHRFLRERFEGQPNLSVEEIHGLHLVIEDNELDKSESLWSNIEDAPAGIKKNIEVYRKVVSSFEPEVVISDFESWAFLFGRRHGIPVISIDNMQVLNRCEHDREVTQGKSIAFRMARFAVKSKLPGAYHYLVTSFFFPKVRKKKTTLVGPILRPEILAAKREPGEHVLVYQTASTNTELLPLLKTLPYDFRVYGMGREGREGNIELRGFSETGFIDDLRTARAVLAGGGFSLMGEAVHLHVPMLSVPIEGQFEQVLNARYLEKLGYGRFAKDLTRDVVDDFLAHTDEHQRHLEAYPSPSNEMLFGCLEELLKDVELDEPPPARLEAPAMGKYDGSLGDDDDPLG